MSDWKVSIEPDNGWGCGSIIGTIILIIIIAIIVGSCS